MSSLTKVFLAALLMMPLPPALAALNLKPETTPPPAEGPLNVADIGPIYSHPLPADKPAIPAAPSKAEKSQPKKNDILSLFQDKEPKVEKNPLEEEAKNEMKALQDPENSSSDQQKVIQLGENNPVDAVIETQAAPKELDLDKASPDSKNLPGILR